MAKVLNPSAGHLAQFDTDNTSAGFKKLHGL
jgi:hypothetical protein